MSDNSRAHFNFTMKLNMKGNYERGHYFRQFLQQFGFGKEQDKEKLSFKPAQLDKDEEIQHEGNANVNALQKSEYIMVNTNPKTVVDKFVTRDIESEPVNFRFVHIDEVNRKQMAFERFKLTYLSQ